ncbi:MAG TPA: hypothetical protein VFT05_16310 [Burkholderiaceae bacterium]|nr:hypothetical protein [Burkholderiaceae bacterium]
MSDAGLRQQCHTVLPGHRQPAPAATFTAMPARCEADGVAHDSYGDGALLQQCVSKVAALPGKQAPVSRITGTMVQVPDAHVRDILALRAAALVTPVPN